jgi:hypothetical protein
VFVTSDNVALSAAAARLEFEWRECILCGVVAHAFEVPTAPKQAAFMLEAAERCGIFEQTEWASYTHGQTRTQRFIKPASLRRLAAGELKGAIGAEGVLLTGAKPEPGTRRGSGHFGGETNALRERPLLSEYDRRRELPVRSFRGHFLFPLSPDYRQIAADLLQLASDILGCSYGYLFLRDEAGFPGGYACGMGTSLTYHPRDFKISEEIAKWADYAVKEMWEASPPPLRDLYALNMLDADRLTAKVEGLTLADWITDKPGRGRLSEIDGSRQLWSLTDQEMYDVRPILHEAGLIFSLPDRVYRDLPHANAG